MEPVLNETLIYHESKLIYVFFTFFSKKKNAQRVENN